MSHPMFRRSIHAAAIAALTALTLLVPTGGAQTPVSEAAGAVHPVHIHFEEFRTLKRFVNGVEVPVPPLQSGRKDVSRLEAGQGALIKMQFRDYNGRYLIHCHNMAHEDAFMMVRWDICPDQASLDACLADQQVCKNELESKLRLDQEVA